MGLGRLARQKNRRSVDHVLCSLPFEKEWYRQRDVAAHYVGHPYFDELPAQRLDLTFEQEQHGAGTIIGLLPGSRNQELTANLPTLLLAAQMIHAKRPETRFLVACFKPTHREQVESALRSEPMPFIQAHVGKTPEIINVAHSCIAVSGSVSLELLYRAKPSIIVYRAQPFLLFLSRYMKKCRYMSLVNLLADEELYPEFLAPSVKRKASAGACSNGWTILLPWSCCGRDSRTCGARRLARAPANALPVSCSITCAILSSPRRATLPEIGPCK